MVSAEPTRQIFSLNQLSRRPGVFAPTLVHVIYYYYYARVFCRKLLWRSNFVEERECLCACVCSMDVVKRESMFMLIQAAIV